MTKYSRNIRIIVWCLVIVLVSFYCGKWYADNFNFPIGITYRWQELIGAFVGAATPVGLYLWQENRGRKKKYADLLLLLEKNLVLAINNLSDFDRMIHGFLDKELVEFKANVANDEQGGRWSVGQAFIPLSVAFTFDKNLLQQNTESNYLENLFLDTFSVSQELPLMIADLHRQFDQTIIRNGQFGVMKLNGHSAHNKMVLDNLKQFENMVRIQFFQHNIPVYLKKLVSTKIVLQTMIEWGQEKWREQFDYPVTMPTEERMLKMNDFFEDKINQEIRKIQGSFKSRLLLVGGEVL